MKWKIPRPEKACCCIPLRRGIITLVYINLFVALVAHVMFLYMDYMKWILRLWTSSKQEQLGRISRTKITPWITILMLIGGGVAEVVMTVVALVGLHRKSLKVIKAYMHYALVFLVAMVIYRVYDSCLLLWRWDIPVFTVYLGIKIYYIITIRSQVKKMERKAKEADIAQVELEEVLEDDTQTNTKTTLKQIRRRHSNKYEDDTQTNTKKTEEDTGETNEEAVMLVDSDEVEIHSVAT